MIGLEILSYNTKSGKKKNIWSFNNKLHLLKKCSVIDVSDQIVILWKMF